MTSFDLYTVVAAGGGMCWLQPVVAGSLAGHVLHQHPLPAGPRHLDVRGAPAPSAARTGKQHRVPDAQVSSV